MGMYAKVYGIEVKLTGLLATVVRNEANAGFLPDVELSDHPLKGDRLLSSFATVSRKEVEEVVLPVMRMELLDGHINKATGWFESLHPEEEPRPFCNLQDIMRYATDVANFERLVCWLHYTSEKSITWA